MVELNTSTTPLNHYSGHRDAAKGRQRLKIAFAFYSNGIKSVFNTQSPGSQ